MHYLSTSAPCDNNSAPFHLSYLLAPTAHFGIEGIVALAY
jgi:hypothetical protein